MVKCKEIMATVKRVVVPTDTVYTAAQIMKNHNVSAIPVVASRQSNELVGVIAERDVTVRVIGEALPAQTTIGEVMTASVATCGPEDDIEKAMKLMNDLQTHHIPIVDQEGNFLGIINKDVAA